jgi:hypothetical protein
MSVQKGGLIRRRSTQKLTKRLASLSTGQSHNGSSLENRPLQEKCLTELMWEAHAYISPFLSATEDESGAIHEMASE